MKGVVFLFACNGENQHGFSVIDLEHEYWALEVFIFSIRFSSNIDP